MIHILSWTTKASNNTFQAATFKVVEIEGLNFKEKWFYLSASDGWKVAGRSRLNFKEKWNSRTFLDCANPGSIHLHQTDGKSLDDLNWARRQTFHELNSLSLVRLMKSSTFGLDPVNTHIENANHRKKNTGDVSTNTH